MLVVIKLGNEYWDCDYDCEVMCKLALIVTDLILFNMKIGMSNFEVGFKSKEINKILNLNNFYIFKNG